MSGADTYNDLMEELTEGDPQQMQMLVLAMLNQLIENGHLDRQEVRRERLQLQRRYDQQAAEMREKLQAARGRLLDEAPEDLQRALAGAMTSWLGAPGAAIWIVSNPVTVLMEANPSRQSPPLIQTASGGQTQSVLLAVVFDNRMLHRTPESIAQAVCPTLMKYMAARPIVQVATLMISHDGMQPSSFWGALKEAVEDGRAIFSNEGEDRHDASTD